MQGATRETSFSPQPVEQQIQENRCTPPVLQPPREAEQIDLAPHQRDSPVCSPTAFTGSVSNNSAPYAPAEEPQRSAEAPQQPDPVALPSPLPLSSLSYPEVASAPPAVRVQYEVLVDALAPQQLFDEPMQLDEGLEPADPVVPEECYEGEPSSQYTPIPAEFAKPTKLSIRTPIEGVPEMHDSALRDTPSRASAPPPIMCPPTHMAGVPETNAHLPGAGYGVQARQKQCLQALPLTPPSQLGGVPEVHLSAWAPPAQPRLVHDENCDGEVMDQDAEAATPAHDGLTAASRSPPHSRITHPTSTPSFSYVVPDHPVLIHSNPSPILSPRSRLVRESADGNPPPARAASTHGAPQPPQGTALAIPPCTGNNSSQPSTAEGSISLCEADPPAGVAGGTADEMTAWPWYMASTGLTPEGYTNAAVGTTPLHHPMPLCEQEQGASLSSDPPSARTRQRRAATVSRSQRNEPALASTDPQTERGHSAKRMPKDDLSHGVRASKKTRSGGRSEASGTASQRSRSTRSGKQSSACSGDVPESEAAIPRSSPDASGGAGRKSQPLAPVVELTEEALGAHDGRPWGPAGEGCSRWLDTNSGDLEACDAGPENDSGLWCGDDFGGGEFDAGVVIVVAVCLDCELRFYEIAVSTL